MLNTFRACICPMSCLMTGHNFVYLVNEHLDIWLCQLLKHPNHQMLWSDWRLLRYVVTTNCSPLCWWKVWSYSNSTSESRFDRHISRASCILLLQPDRCRFCKVPRNWTVTIKRHLLKRGLRSWHVASGHPRQQCGYKQYEGTHDWKQEVRYLIDNLCINWMCSSVI
jgi:hypothetical protein